MLTATSHIFYKKIERRRNAAHTKNVQNVFMMLIVVYATFRKMSSLSQPFLYIHFSFLLLNLLTNKNATMTSITLTISIGILIIVEL